MASAITHGIVRAQNHPPPYLMPRLDPIKVGRSLYSFHIDGNSSCNPKALPPTTARGYRRRAADGFRYSGNRGAVACSCQPGGYQSAAPAQSPTAAHWAGTDEFGRDTLSRLLWGARISLTVSTTVVAVSLAVGLTIGGLAGYLGGWIDTALTTVAMNTFLALPGVLLAIAFAAFLGPGFSNLVLALAIGGWAGYARLVRAQVLSVRDREYVDAARSLGAGGVRIFVHHILPNILQPVLVQAAIGMAGVISPRLRSVPRPGHPRPGAKLGSHAQRGPLSSFRLPSPRDLPRHRRGGRGARIQLPWRRPPRPP